MKKDPFIRKKVKFPDVEASSKISIQSKEKEGIRTLL